jgi:signal transduction histidine kinase
MKGEHLGPDDPSERMRAEERHRLALYLHDHVGQILTLTKLQLARIQQALREPVDPAKQAWLQTIVDSLIPELDAVMQTLQEEVFVLSPTGLTEVGLTAMLEQECVGFSRRTGIPCDSRCESLNLDGQRSALVVLIVREALSNVARHSRATTAEVILQRSGKHGILSVRDNGMGFDSIRTRAAESFGVRGMEKRARTLGAELNVESTPTEGTCIRISFPLAPRLKNTSLPD